MHGGEAKKLLGFPPNSHPTLSQVKAAYKQKAWETHPDRFPALQKSMAESNFKLISEAYSSLLVDQRYCSPAQASYVRVVRTGVPRGTGKSHPFLVKAPFLALMMATVSLGGAVAARTYLKQRKEFPSQHPFLP
ncbi:uncharacterized protein LOC116261948 [Nymphaea colorata]|nr:uncharacterized protein LOC116261948 [Nymphaea colorata]